MSTTARIIHWTWLALTLAGFLSWAGRSLAADSAVAVLGAEPAQVLQLAAGKSLVLRAARDVSRVSLADPDLAGVVPLSSRQIYLTGRKSGATTLTLWGADGRIMAVCALEIGPDLAQLKRMLHTVLPGETGIQVLSTGGSVTLSGGVSSAVNLSTALALAEAAAPGGKVVNLLRVGGVHQVMLEVRVAEMSRSLMKRLGINFNYMKGGDVFYSFLNQLTSLDPTKGILTLSPHVSAAFTTTSNGVSWSGFIDALKSDGLVKVLAEPNLVCLSGESASFLAGGEIPIPIPQGLGTVSVEFKPFGVGLAFTPTVLSSGKINIRVQPEVSELDYTNAIPIGGFTIPAFSTRRASTVVELGSGQSFAVAGLIKDTLRENANKFPVLGDIPVLGTLFRSTDFQKNESELIIIVTPHLAKPLDRASQTLPTDGFKEPTDWEFYALGLLESREHGAKAPAANRPATTPGSGFDGEFGHALPR